MLLQRGTLPAPLTRANQIVSSEDLSNGAVWGLIGTASVTGTDVLNVPASDDYIFQTVATGSVTGKWFTFSGYIAGSGTINVFMSDGVADASSETTLTLSAAGFRFQKSYKFSGSGTVVNVFVIHRAATTATSCTLRRVALNEAPFAATYRAT